MSFKQWAAMVGQAAVQGALVALSGMLASGHAMSVKEMAAVAGSGALVAAANHVRKSPSTDEAAR